ncbi:hypothetical protein [Rhizohabitans arisaemae]|uniref:hypothetical protein n=1 Tax=Rhizohabitans arisaemae TaxID=2720610 RepID=UPI0024B05DD4|nr:hypothetical protein [Rhizohabitans arisaemae]
MYCIRIERSSDPRYRCDAEGPRLVNNPGNNTVLITVHESEIDEEYARQLSEEFSNHTVRNACRRPPDDLAEEPIEIDHILVAAEELPPGKLVYVETSADRKRVIAFHHEARFPRELASRLALLVEEASRHFDLL